jgi:hypothetical protein
MYAIVWTIIAGAGIMYRISRAREWGLPWSEFLALISILLFGAYWLA